MSTTITEPGIYDLPAHVYHADPVPGGSLSSSGARKLLRPSCPALFRHWLDFGQEPQPEFDLGHAAHREVLGVGEPIHVIDAGDYRTKDARAQRDAAHADGRVPILAHEYERVRAMAAALREHPIAGAIFQPDQGRPEQSIIWTDPRTGVWRRAMLDWLPHPAEGRRLIITDYKTCASAEPDAISRSLHHYGYYQQAAWYLDAVGAAGLASRDDAAFVLVCQEKTPPYLVTVGQPDPEALAWGDRLNAKAIDTYATCRATGRWPGYAEDVISVSLPTWAVRAHEDALLAGHYALSYRSPAA